MLLPLLHGEEDLVLHSSTAQLVLFWRSSLGNVWQKAKGKPLPDSVEERYK